MNKRLKPTDPRPTDTPLQRQIRRRLGESGLNQKSLSEAAGLGETFIRDILRGQSDSPSGDNLAKVADVLGCTSDELQEIARPRGNYARSPSADADTRPSIAIPSPVRSGNDKLDYVCGEISGAWESIRQSITGRDFEAATIFLSHMRERCELAKALCVIAADDELERRRDT